MSKSELKRMNVQQSKPMMEGVEEGSASAVDALVMKKLLTKAQIRGLEELYQAEILNFDIPYPGAIGRAGTGLVKKGLAMNLGRTVFAGSYHQGCIPEAWVKFKLTDKGTAVARELFSS